MAANKKGLVPLEEIRDTPLAVDVPGLRKLTFAPNPEHDGRHIEWVPEPLARELMTKYNGRFQKLAIAEDLIYGDGPNNPSIDPIRQAVMHVLDQQDVEDIVYEKVKVVLAAAEKKAKKKEHKED